LLDGRVDGGHASGLLGDGILGVVEVDVDGSEVGLLEATQFRDSHGGEAGIIPLLQIAPSKTDAERVIPANPELASVLAQIISRVTAADGKIALVSRRD
jgi:hypothetical protein